MKRLIVTGAMVAWILVIIFSIPSEGKEQTFGEMHSQPGPAPVDYINYFANEREATMGPGSSSTASFQQFYQIDQTYRNAFRLCKYLGGMCIVQPIGINFYLNPKFTSNNYVITSDDSACAGNNVFASDVVLQGDWFTKGGPNDHPPITWISKERLDEVVKKIADLNKNSQQDKVARYTYGQDLSSLKSDYFSEVTLYTSSPYLWAIHPDLPPAYTSIICASNSQTTSDNKELDFKDDNTFQVDENVPTNFEFSYNPECYLYVEKFAYGGSGGGGWEQLTKKTAEVERLEINVYMLYKLPMESFKKTIDFQPATTTQKPNLEVADYSITDAGIVRMIVTNTGSTDAQLDDIKSNYGFSITNKPLIKAGETKEVFGQLSDSNVDKETISFNPVYRATELGCLNTKSFGPSTAGGCSMDKDCENGLCCLGKCRDATKGFCDDLNRDGTPDTWTVFETSN